MALQDWRPPLQSTGSGTASVPAVAWRLPAPASPDPTGRVLLVDDAGGDIEIASPLTAAGFAVRRVREGQRALDLLQREALDLVLLDARPAGTSGFHVCREIRRRSAIPIIFLATAGALPERLLAFDLGADDCVTRPAVAEELERRVRAVLRRSRPAARSVELDGPAGIRLALLEHEVRVHGLAVAVTPKEFDLLRLLLQRRGEVLTPDAISLALWGYETMGSRNFVEAHVSRLRSKLANAGAGTVVETVRGVGYVVR